MISFVIPAYNEERLLGGTLRALDAAARALAEPFEIIVADDASTDRTAALAADHGARVVTVHNRQIAATRNAGARAASGEILFFVDADTQANAAAVRAGVQALRRGAVGGGCVFTFDGPVPLWMRLVLPPARAICRTVRLVGGAFLFCRREAFEAIGGFSERYYASEELFFIQALKRLGRFVVVRPSVRTSNRKISTLSVRALLSLAFRAALRGGEAFSSRDGLELWYDPATRDEEPK